MRTIAGSAGPSHGRLLVVDDDQVQRTIIGKIGAKLDDDAAGLFPPLEQPRKISPQAAH
jgi:hypothetical protein